MSGNTPWRGAGAVQQRRLCAASRRLSNGTCSSPLSRCGHRALALRLLRGRGGRSGAPDRVRYRPRDGKATKDARTARCVRCLSLAPAVCQGVTILNPGPCSGINEFLGAETNTRTRGGSWEGDAHTLSRQSGAAAAALGTWTNTSAQVRGRGTATVGRRTRHHVCACAARTRRRDGGSHALGHTADTRCRAAGGAVLPSGRPRAACGRLFGGHCLTPCLACLGCVRRAGRRAHAARRPWQQQDPMINR